MGYMWPFFKRSARRKEIRRSRAERGLTWSVWLASRLQPWTSGLALAAAGLAAVVVNLGGDALTVRPGETLSRGIVARLEFSVENPARTLEMRLRARNSAEHYYQLDASLLQEIRGRLTNALQLAKEHAHAPDQLLDSARQAHIVLDEDGRNELARIATLTDKEEFQQAVERFQKAVDSAVDRLANQPPLLAEAVDPAQRRTPVNAILITPEDKSGTGGVRQHTVPVALLLSSNRAEAVETVVAAAAQVFSPPLRQAMRNTIVELLRGEPEGTFKPIYRYLADESERAAQAAFDRVPVQLDTYPRDRLLASTGILSADGYRLLRHEHEAYRRWLASGAQPLTAEERARLQAEHPEAYERVVAEREAARAAWYNGWLAAAGYGVLAMCVAVGLTYHVAQARRTFRLSPARQVVAALILLALLAAARLVYVGTSSPYYAVGVQALAAALLAIVFARGPVLAFTASLALLTALAVREGVGFLLVLLAVSMTLRLGLRDIRVRGKIVVVGIAAAGVALATTIAAGLIAGQTLAFVLWHQALPAAGTTLAAVFLVEGLLPALERLFKISTSMTLLEWCDASRPLLRLLASEAPGTYNHSLTVGALAEAAAEAVGGNGLLARTGAYYHDIGKINKPEYFVENQALGASRHERLSPAMSHLIIIGHVKDGIEMAREYGLPADLHQFITGHHGTTLVQYFYHAASAKRKPGDAEVSDVQFRYPGPKPQSREAAIVMICDGVEGAVRAMPEPTPARIEDVVTKVARQRLLDGQFDECELTFRELETVERSLVKSLCAIYHARIAYPAAEKNGRAPETRAS